MCLTLASVPAERTPPYGAAMDILGDPRYRVPSVPPAPHGAAWLRANVARFSEGDDHARRRALVDDLVSTVSIDQVRRPGSPVANLAEALGVAADAALAADVACVARSYQPHAPQHPEADDAVGRLVERCGGGWDERTAALIGVLVQACDATQAMIDGIDPPVPHTRRVAPDGTVVLVDLADAPFGAGRHRCPGQEIALAMVEGAHASRRLDARK